MRICVIGAGAVGGYFGGRLAQSGQDVVFLVRGAHLRAMQERGLFVQSIKGDFRIHPVNAGDSPLAIGKADAVLVAVKTWQLPGALPQLGALLHETSYVVPLLNGVEAAEQIALSVGRNRVVGGLCRIFSYIAEPGKIVHAGVEPHVAFGELDNQPSQRTEELKEAFERAAVSVEIPRDIHVAIWRKFLFVAPSGSVGALTRAPIGIIRSVPETRRLLQDVMHEIYRVAKACNVALPEDAPRKTLDQMDKLLPSLFTSMQRDIMEGRPSELEAQTGVIVRLGLQHDLPTPAHNYIYGSLLPQELRARKQIEF